MTNLRQRPRGFTLLEVMVALAILSAAMLIFSQVTGAALRNHTRAVRLEVATLLARGMLASLQDRFDKDGFRDFDETDEGTFEGEGHPEVRFKLEVKRPQIELGPDQILSLLLGGKPDEAPSDLMSLLSGKAQDPQASDSSAELVLPGAQALAGLVRVQLTTIGEQLKKGLREIRLTVAWQDGAREESFSVVTHLVSFPKGISP